MNSSIEAERHVATFGMMNACTSVHSTPSPHTPFALVYCVAEDSEQNCSRKGHIQQLSQADVTCKQLHRDHGNIS